jgi:hypothetical protein
VNQEGQQQNTKRQVTGLDRVGTDLAKARTDIDAELAEVDRALEAAAPLIERLDEDTKADIQRRLTAIDKEISDAEAAVAAESGKVRDLTAERDQRSLGLAVRQAAYDEATAALTGLPAALKAEAAVLKRDRTELVAACTGGQDLKAFVLVAEVSKGGDQVGALRDTAHEAKLVKDLQDAEKGLASAREALANAELALADQQELLAQRSLTLKALKDARAVEVKQLYTSTEAAPAVAAARGA